MRMAYMSHRRSEISRTFSGFKNNMFQRNAKEATIDFFQVSDVA